MTNVLGNVHGGKCYVNFIPILLISDTVFVVRMLCVSD